MHLVFWGILAAAWSAASCDAENFYPDSFLLTNSFFIGMFLMIYKMKEKDFMIEWDESESVARKLFQAQMERYWSFYTFLVEWHLFELVLAKMLDTFNDSFACSADGKSWIYTSPKGNLFFTLHIMGSMMGLGMTRAVFIKTAKTEGMLGGLDKEDDIK